MTNLQITYDSTTWTAVVASQDCDYIQVAHPSSASVAKVRTTSGDPTTESQFLPGDLIPNSVPPHSLRYNTSAASPRRYRYRKGDVAFYLQNVTGTATGIQREEI